jgi:hypothetical protein
MDAVSERTGDNAEGSYNSGATVVAIYCVNTASASSRNSQVNEFMGIEVCNPGRSSQS